MSILAQPEWSALTSEAASPPSLRSLFADDPERAAKHTHEVGFFQVDLSKQRLTDHVWNVLLGLAGSLGVAERRDAMFRGDKINTTENRSVLHTALRAPRGATVMADGHNVVPDVHDVLDRMAAFADRVRSGSWHGATGKRIRNVINIGIGGSDLGPAMASLALRSWSDRSVTHKFVSNVDGSDIAEALVGLDPAETMFIVSSKTFTTIETMTNARTARSWLTDALGDAAVPKHVVAVSTNAAKVGEFGIDTDNMFGFWDWVGGRYSMDSAIGLSLMLAIGPEQYREMLAGFHDVDTHFCTEPFVSNVPVLMALAGIWERNMLHSPSLGVIPYCNELALFPAYLQQLDMESNGKHVHLDGTVVSGETAPIVWGTPGTNGQHAYFQMLHQGTTIVPLDLIGFASPVHEMGVHHDLLMANMFAQSEALAFGKTADEVRADGVAEDLVDHKVFLGNRPTTILLGTAFSPRALGQLVALYEHKVFVQGTLWDINTYDQWGVELGKVLATRIAGELEGTTPLNAHDSSTTALIARYRSLRGR